MICAAFASMSGTLKITMTYTPNNQCKFCVLSQTSHGMPEFSEKQNPGTENFQTERSRIGKFWDQKIQGIREIFF